MGGGITCKHPGRPKTRLLQNCTGLEIKAAWEHGGSSLGEGAPKIRDLDEVDKQQQPVKILFCTPL